MHFGLSALLAFFFFFATGCNKQKNPFTGVSTASIDIQKIQKRKPPKPIPAYVNKHKSTRAKKQNRQVDRAILRQWRKDKWRNLRQRNLQRRLKYHENAQSLRKRAQTKKER